MVEAPRRFRMGGAQHREDDQVDGRSNILKSKAPAQSLKLLKESKRKGSGTHFHHPSEARDSIHTGAMAPPCAEFGVMQSSIIPNSPSHPGRVTTSSIRGSRGAARPPTVRNLPVESSSLESWALLHDLLVGHKFILPLSHFLDITEIQIAAASSPCGARELQAGFGVKL